MLREKGRITDGMLHVWLKVKPGSKRESLEIDAVGNLVLRVAAPARDGEANERVIGLMAELLDIPKSRVHIVRGTSAKTKEIAILLDDGSMGRAKE
jgi:uncharacterized protein YggU (UPF0235/DUF167 family)